MKSRKISNLVRTIGGGVFGFILLAGTARAQQALTWDQVKAKFEAANPTLKADEINVDRKSVV